MQLGDLGQEDACERSHRRRRAAIPIREHGLHHDRPVAGKRRALAKARCRSGTSFARGEGQRSFADGFGRKEQRLADIVSLEVGVQRENTLCGLPFSHAGNVKPQCEDPSAYQTVSDVIHCLAVRI
jgi:hypothetical protein